MSQIKKAIKVEGERDRKTDREKQKHATKRLTKQSDKEQYQRLSKDIKRSKVEEEDCS